MEHLNEALHGRTTPFQPKVPWPELNKRGIQNDDDLIERRKDLLALELYIRTMSSLSANDWLLDFTRNYLADHYGR